MTAYSLFERYGIELEYMIVGRKNLKVKPIADQLLASFAGAITEDYVSGPITWSNELVLHVIELKTSEPTRALWPTVELFQKNIQIINEHLAKEGACLLSTGMHPLMDPTVETRLWPHGCNAIYRAFDSIFDCRGHGWSNLQSVHLNLPFANDHEFYRLHTAIRLLLPLIPALAASSPLVGGRISTTLDTRLECYRYNCKKIPSITGMVIPETVLSKKDYKKRILKPIYANLPATNPKNILLHEWVNARGAIARFERGSIEIRVIDTQECPKMDIALLCFLVNILKALVDERWSSVEFQGKVSTETLASLFVRVLTEGEKTLIADPDYLALWGLPAAPCCIGEVLEHLFEEVVEPTEPWALPVRYILNKGCLARRIIAALGKKPSIDTIKTVYQRIADCLGNGNAF